MSLKNILSNYWLVLSHLPANEDLIEIFKNQPYSIFFVYCWHTLTLKIVNFLLPWKHLLSLSFLLSCWHLVRELQLVILSLFIDNYNLCFGSFAAFAFEPDFLPDGQFPPDLPGRPCIHPRGHGVVKFIPGVEQIKGYRRLVPEVELGPKFGRNQNFPQQDGPRAQRPSGIGRFVGPNGAVNYG